MKKNVLILGSGGFIGSHLTDSLKEEGHIVTGIDIKYPEFEKSSADHFIKGDLRDKEVLESVFENQEFDEIYQLAADMGGAGYVFTGENDSDILHNSVMINLNLLEILKSKKKKRVFYSSSACIYPEHNQLDPENPMCSEDSAYPANPDSNYGWEKLFSERLFFAYAKNHGINAKVGRYHNIYGPKGTWQGGREKAPAALCRKIALATKNEDIEIWGSGKQTRSFLYIDDCIEATKKLMRSEGFSGPLNIGSEEMISINNLAKLIGKVSNKKITIKNIKGPIGVNGRNSDNRLIEQHLNWTPSYSLEKGLEITLEWIVKRILLNKKKAA